MLYRLAAIKALAIAASLAAISPRWQALRESSMSLNQAGAANPQPARLNSRQNNAPNKRIKFDIWL